MSPSHFTRASQEIRHGARVCKFLYSILGNHYFHREVSNVNMKNKITKLSKTMEKRIRKEKNKNREYSELEATLYKLFQLVKPESSANFYRPKMVTFNLISYVRDFISIHSMGWIIIIPSLVMGYNTLY